MKKFSIFLIFILTTYSLLAQDKVQELTLHNQTYQVQNRTLTDFEENGKKGVRFSEGAGSGIAWLVGMNFTEGVIEFDAKGRDELQSSFIGVAFHAVNDSTMETVYFRPFNFNVSDSVRNIHAIQYAFEPKFTWQKLRQTRKDEFERAIGVQNISRTDWFHVKIEVRNGRIKVFVNDSKTPQMDVPTLNPEGKSGKLGLWVGNSSNGDFANVSVRP